MRAPAGNRTGARLRSLICRRPRLRRRFRCGYASWLRYAANPGDGLEVTQAGLLDHDVGRDALRLDRTARRRVVKRGRQAYRTVPGNRNDGLHRTLAERLRAQDNGAAVILQCARDDFRRRRRAPVDQYDQRQAVDQVARFRVEPLRFTGLSAACRDNFTLLQKGVGDLDRLVEQAARIAAQIENGAGKRVAKLFFDLANFFASPLAVCSLNVVTRR